MLSINHTSLLLDEFEKELRLIEHQNNLAEENKNKHFYFRFIKGSIFDLFGKIMHLTKASHLVNTFKTAIKKDYTVFLKSDERGKEDILLEWTKIEKEASKIILSNPAVCAENGNLSQRKIHYLLNIIVDFERKLKNELYGRHNTDFSQEYLKELASKYSHLPKAILDDLSSDKYSESL